MRIKGYSLIEILVVLAILGMLFAAGYANFRDFTRRQAASNSTKGIAADLRLAQQLALSGQKPSDANCTGTNVLNGFFFHVLSSSHYEIRASCTGVNPPPATKDVQLPAGVAIASPFPVPNPLLFKVLGSGTNIVGSSNTVITVKQVISGATQTVTVTGGGEIK